MGWIPSIAQPLGTKSGRGLFGPRHHGAV